MRKKVFKLKYLAADNKVIEYKLKGKNHSNQADEKGCDFHH